MTLLHACLLDRFRPCIRIGEGKELDEHALFSNINELSKSYSTNFVLLLNEMLRLDERLRPDPSDLVSRIKSLFIEPSPQKVSNHSPASLLFMSVPFSSVVNVNTPTNNDMSQRSENQYSSTSSLIDFNGYLSHYLITGLKPSF